MRYSLIYSYIFFKYILKNCNDILIFLKLKSWEKTWNIVNVSSRYLCIWHKICIRYTIYFLYTYFFLFFFLFGYFFSNDWTGWIYISLTMHFGNPWKPFNFLKRVYSICTTLYSNTQSFLKVLKSDYLDS